MFSQENDHSFVDNPQYLVESRKVVIYETQVFNNKK